MSSRCIAGRGTPASAWAACPTLTALPDVQPALLVSPDSRAVIVTPHPDDEVLGSGGLLAHLGGLGRQMLIIAVTDGTASHPGSPGWTPVKLAVARPLENAQALRRLGLEHIPVIHAHFPDGELCAQEAPLSAFLTQHLSPQDVVFTTWREDGHPDHEATGRACARAATAVNARLIETLIWAWHWAAPGDARIPWDRAARITLGPRVFQLKQHAIGAYTSQIEPDAATGSEPVLPPHVLARLVRDYEVLLL